MTLDQGPKVLIKGEGKTVYLPCKVTDLGSSDYIHWYQIKDGEAPSRLLYISQGGSVAHDTNNPQANDFTVEKSRLYDLKLRNTQKNHAAVYFCAYWDTSSGTVRRFTHILYINWQMLNANIHLRCHFLFKFLIWLELYLHRLGGWWYLDLFGLEL